MVPSSPSSHSSPEVHYRQYRCVNGDPLSCQQCHPKPFQEGAKDCQICQFPALLDATAQIRGIRGIYAIDRELGKRGQGRLYQGHRVPEADPVIIKEYVLPARVFNETSRKERKRAFTRLAGLTLADGRSQDFRLITPDEAIADEHGERCYLIRAGAVNAYPSLSNVLPQYGAMTSRQVRRVLEQVLQTLDFLHQQKFRFPNGQVKSGLVHGNLSLESLLIRNGRVQSPLATGGAQVSSSSQEMGWEDDFLIYVSDFGMWEFLFLPPTLTPPEPTIADDLRALGGIAIALLTGSTTEPTSANPLDAVLQSLPDLTPAFKDYLLQLAGVSLPFNTAEAARQALFKLPTELSEANVTQPIRLERGDRGRKVRWSWKQWFWMLLLLIGGGLFFWWLSLVLRNPNSVETANSPDKLLCCMAEVTSIPSGRFTYTAVQPSTWNYTLLQPNMVEVGKTFDEVLQERQPKLELVYQPSANPEAALAQVRSQEAAFLITTLMDQVSADLNAQAIAYDGLSVFVAFSYAFRSNSLPRHLNGKITLEQLRQLYTGKIKNWQDLGGPDLPVKLYIPVETEAIRLFEQKVLQDADSIARFRSLITTGEITKQTSFATFRQMLRDFEQNQIGAIAFGPLSQVFGQCSVYPLAIVDFSGTSYQALIDDKGQPITPETNLCAAKGSYDQNTELFQTQRYPLGYSLLVVFPKDNRQAAIGRKFAETLRTEEGQRLLHKTGLVPLQPLLRREDGR